MTGRWRQDGGPKALPGDRAGGSCGSPAADTYVRLLAARGLVGLATGLLRVVERAFGAGYLDLAQVEYCVRVSARLRRLACRLIGTNIGDAPFPLAATRGLSEPASLV